MQSREQHTIQQGGSLLLTTRLSIPPLRSDLVERPRLFQKLKAALHSPFTLLAAPAGFGKTVLLSAWARQQPQTIGWVSLETGDNDPVQFWTYVLAALEALHPGIGETALSLLQSAQPASMETILATLLNALGTLRQRIVLILDDYHVIEEPSIHRAMTFLLEHLPPLCHLLLASRVDPPLPLARLRARRQLVELRVDDLRFTYDEAAIFLNQLMGFSLTEHDIAALERRTEGWIAGLQLAALSMQGRKDIAGFISAFTGSHRYIVDYLTGEVLQQQPERVCNFLLQTSPLERLHGSLCDAVLEQDGSQSMLEYLEQANLFLLPLDDERHWYRYHHLFAEALRFRLHQTRPDLLPVLYQRASAWYETHGFPPEAVDYALAARDFERAATLIEPILYPMFNYGTHATVRHWLQALPEEALFRRPSLCIQYAWAFLYIGEIASCQRPLEAAERAWRAEGNLHRLGEVYIFQSSIALVQGDALRTLDYARLARPLLSEDDRINRCNYATYVGASALLLGNMREASRLLNDALTQCQPVHLYSTLYTMNFMAEMQMVQGRLHEAAATSREVMSKLGGRASIHSCQAFSRLSRISLEWNKLDLAAQHMRQALALGEQAGQALYMSPVYLADAQLHRARGEMREAFAALTTAEQTAQRLGRRPVIAQARAIRARWELAQGNLLPAERWGEEADIHPSDEPPFAREVEYLMLARLLLTQQRTEEAAAVLERLLSRDEAEERTGSMIAVLALLALVYWQQKNLERALGVLDRLLTLAEPGGYVRVFVDEGPSMHALLTSWLSSPAHQRSADSPRQLVTYARKLWAAFPVRDTQFEEHNEALKHAETAPSRAPLLEPLTAREQDVLELVQAGLSNGEIAERLTVSVGTVKTHIKSVYGKLGVHSRTQAIARAREIGLLLDRRS